MTLTSEVQLLPLITSTNIDFGLIRSAIRSRRDEIVQSEAYAHPYGFVVFNLSRFGDEGEGLIRFHVWPMDRIDRGADNYLIHDHIYSVESVVLCGELEQTRYQTENDLGPTHAVYLGSYGRNSSTITPTTKAVKLAVVARERFAAGDRYSLRAGDLHSVRVGSQTTATVLATKRSPKLSEPRIFGPLPAAEATLFVRERLGLTDKRRLLEEVIDCFDTSSI